MNKQQQSATKLGAIVVTGLRNGLASSMNVKRNAIGFVDAIAAEAIGKFPDTNIAGALQQIPGVSINRRQGAGAQVTVCGFGPGFNMVLVDGRRVPGADAFGNGFNVVGGIGSGSRAFDFAELSPDDVNRLIVHKTGRANVDGGGIGVTINVITDKPFFHKGGKVVANISGKGIYDTSEPFSRAAHLPVIVFIPGGAFVVGSGSVPVYNGARLAERGAVIVTINYRLGVFGYLALPALREQSPHHSTGDYGLLDQIAALRWVKHNIARFGGNPDDVTVWGQSAGAMSVGVLLASPLAKGLFERAVADSALNASREIVLSYAKAAQTGLKYMHSHGAASVAELRKESAQELLKGQSIGQFGPVVDGWTLKSSAERVDMYGGGVDVPVITGNQANDWRLFAPHVESLVDYQKYIRSLYGRRAKDFERLYPAADVAQAIAALRNSSRDRDRVSMYVWASTRAEHYKSPVYTYFFTRAIPWPEHPGFGAFHTGELPYLFDNLSLLNRPWSSSDRSLARLMGTFLTNFARAGRLSSWRSAKKGEYATNELGGALSPVAMPLIGGSESKRVTKLDFWKSVFATPMGVKMPPF